MSSHLLWFRLSHGKVWHVACSGAQVALCGQSIPTRGERQPKRPPFGARPCPDCDNVAIEAATALGLAITSHKGPVEMVSRAFLGTPLPMVVEPTMTGNQVIVGDFGGES